MQQSIPLFIATGNRDKVARVERWLTGLPVKLSAPFMLNATLAEQTKISDAEEQQAGDMEARACAKAAKAAAVLKDSLVLAMDDTAYLPWIDTYIIDLRSPQALFADGRKVSEQVTKRLEGAELANFYARLAAKTATPERMLAELEPFGIKQLPETAFMPLEWRFALAAGWPGESPRIIARWGWRQYIHNVLLNEEPDSGYMIGKISSDHPLGEPGEHVEVGAKEDIPAAAVARLIQDFSLVQQSI